MSKKMLLESTSIFKVWQEINVPDEFDTSDRDAMLELFSMIPYPEAANRDPHNGKAEFSQHMAWEDGRLCYSELLPDRDGEPKRSQSPNL